MPRCFRLKTLFAALVVAGLVAGCDTDYDATADLQTEEDNRQQLTDAETRSSDDSVAYDAANPAFDYSANNRNGGNATNYDNERSIQIDQAGTEETVYFPADLATLTQDEESDLRQFAESIRGQDLSQMQISIESYAASNGSEEYNKQLSELRAEAVRDFLQGAGVDVANWDMKTLANGRLPESTLQDQTESSGGAVSGGAEPSETDATDSNRVIVSLEPYTGQQEDQLGSLN